ncbi:MAG: SDR family NAD(P)-dependent oxidoreductase [Polyangiaceae bacterium]|nr:SDR family NAD(P)-dependent oxidoreductase [Polyangiaceae bacterium]
MTLIERTIEVRRPLAECFAFAADFAHIASWDPGVARSDRLDDGGPGVGSRYRVHVRFAGRSVPMSYVIEEWQPPRRVVLRGTSESVRALDEIRFEPSATGTRIDYRANIELTGAVGLLSPLLASTLQRVGDDALAGLSAALDGTGCSGRRPALVHRVFDRLLLPGLFGFTRLGYLRAARNFAPLDDDLTGRVVIVTGATSGLGRAAAERLAALGARVVLVGRDSTKCAAVERELRAQVDGARLDMEVADLASMREVRALAGRLLEKFPAIHVLVNNAGVLLDDREVTSEGLERTLATNLLGHYLLTNELLPRLSESAPARIVNVTSGGMYTQGVKVADLQMEREPYDGVVAYARSKRGQVLLTEHWATALVGRGVMVNAMHPGWAETPGVERSLPRFRRAMARLLRTPEQGADTIVWLAAARQAERETGKLWLDRAPHPAHVLPWTRQSEAERRAFVAALDQLLQAR